MIGSGCNHHRNGGPRGDPTKLELDVVMIGSGEPLTPNDWCYPLDSVGLLFWDQRLAYALRTIASLVMIASLIFGGMAPFNRVQDEQKRAVARRISRFCVNHLAWA
jgi:hypothetical protein